MRRVRALKIICLLLIVLLSITFTSCNKAKEDDYANSNISGEPEPSFQALSIETEELGTLHYWLYTPADTSGSLPLIVYLHSAHSKGDDLSLLLENDGFPKYLHEGLFGDLQAYVVMPQLPNTERDWVTVGSAVVSLIEKTVAELDIDKENISMTGHSVGGTGTWNISISNPGMFSRIAPLSGSVKANKDSISVLKDVPIRAFVGSDDDVIDPVMSERMVEALKAVGGDADTWVFEGAGHEDVPSLTYLDEKFDLVNWLIGKQVTWPEEAESNKDDSSMNMYANSDFIEKEQPELTEDTKEVIAAFQKDPSMENYLALKAAVMDNYDAVLARKEAKLAALREETAGKPGGAAIVSEMEELVQEMYETYWNRINSSLLRFSDKRLLRWKIADASNYDYIPVMGAGSNIFIKRTPVTNSEYALFISETGYRTPSNWANNTYPEGEGDYPVNYISFVDAQEYCKWLTEKDGSNVYRIPSECEWELAAGHMPKDADFNCGVSDGRVSVDKYASVTRGAHGAVDFWGNVWEWTSTERDNADTLGVKGGSWMSPRTDCRTEHRKEGRDPSRGYEDVGFRIIQVVEGKEPTYKASLDILNSPEAMPYEKLLTYMEIF